MPSRRNSNTIKKEVIIKLIFSDRVIECSEVEFPAMLQQHKPVQVQVCDTMAIAHEHNHSTSVHVAYLAFLQKLVNGILNKRQISDTVQYWVRKGVMPQPPTTSPADLGASLYAALVAYQPYRLVALCTKDARVLGELWPDDEDLTLQYDLNALHPTHAERLCESINAHDVYSVTREMVPQFIDILKTSV